MTQILETKYSQQAIQQKRLKIYKQLMLQSANIKIGAITAISTADLYSLFELYDSVFFKNWFKESFKGLIHFSLSRRMTKSAGSTLCPKHANTEIQKLPVFEIRIGVDFFFNYHLAEGSKKVCGINTNSSLEALQLVFEHELCHVLEFIHFNDSNCSGERFKAIAGNLFGHTDSHHQLPTHKKIAYQKLGLKVGDPVSEYSDGFEPLNPMQRAMQSK